ncbi:MAG: hypothetical protein RL076_1323 [Chloroflexota bacterium]|jgi:PPOX class probable F420-dependent enzyme
MAFDALANQQFMNLITQRKSGADVSTPVWFVQEGDRLYVMTGSNAGKVKRIRNNPHVQVAPSDRAGAPLGPSQPAIARVISDASEAATANTLLTKKYGLMKRMFDLMALFNGGANSRAYLVITTPQ